jgi:hypothetical protein
MGGRPSSLLHAPKRGKKHRASRVRELGLQSVCGNASSIDMRLELPRVDKGQKKPFAYILFFLGHVGEGGLVRVARLPTYLERAVGCQGACEDGPRWEKNARGCWKDPSSGTSDRVPVRMFRNASESGRWAYGARTNWLQGTARMRIVWGRM